MPSRDEEAPKGVSAPSLGLEAREMPVLPGGMPRPHAHSDVELNLILRGGFTYLMSGRLHTVEAGRLHVFWAGAPHQVVTSKPETRQIWVTAPLERVLRWGLPDAFIRRLLRGDLMADPAPPQELPDAPLLTRWVRDLRERAPMQVTAAALEIQARLHRFAAAQPKSPPRPARAATPEGRSFDRQTVFVRLAAQIEARALEDAPMAALLTGAGVSADYAGRIFKTCSGLSPLEYRTRLRVAFAQRALIAETTPITDIALGAGFGSLPRFYLAFRRICGTTPRKYRLGLGLNRAAE